MSRVGTRRGGIVYVASQASVAPRFCATFYEVQMLQDAKQFFIANETRCRYCKFCIATKVYLMTLAMFTQGVSLLAASSFMTSGTGYMESSEIDFDQFCARVLQHHIIMIVAVIDRHSLSSHRVSLS